MVVIAKSTHPRNKHVCSFLRWEPEDGSGSGKEQPPLKMSGIHSFLRVVVSLVLKTHGKSMGPSPFVSKVEREGLNCPIGIENTQRGLGSLSICVETNRED